MLGDLRRSAEPPVTLTVTGIADVVQLFTDNVVWLVVTVAPTVVARSRQLAATIPNFASHELYSRTKILLFEATENFSSLL